MSKSIAAMHTAKKQLDLDDDTYRAKLQVITGKSSAKDMTEAERQQVIEVFRKDGYKPAERRPDGSPKLSGRFAGKLQALWIAAHNLGIVENRDDAALLAFVKRQTGLDHVRFLKFPDDARKAIEALKAWIARDGGVDWSVYQEQPAHYSQDGFRIARAQWKKLTGTNDRFWAAVWEITGPIATTNLTKDQWVAVMNAFGRRIRAAGKKAAR